MKLSLVFDILHRRVQLVTDAKISNFNHFDFVHRKMSNLVAIERGIYYSGERIYSEQTHEFSTRIRLVNKQLSGAQES